MATDNDTFKIKVLETVHASFARTLERELTALTAERDQLRAEVARCNDIINRASVQFFHDGTDAETAAKMLKFLNEAKP